jgi:hypothetical protein
MAGDCGAEFFDADGVVVDCLLASSVSPWAM